MFQIYSELRDHFNHHQFEHMFRQILLLKKRLPLYETSVLNLNVDGLLRNIPNIILGLMRPPSVVDSLTFQETKITDVSIPCYNSFYSDEVYDVNSRLQLHGSATFHCNIVSRDGTTIISEQINNLSNYQNKAMKDRIALKNSLSAVLTNYKT